MSEYAGVHILKSPYHIDNVFDYFVPTYLREELKVGDFVTVPFGTSNVREIALVVSLKDFPQEIDSSRKPSYKPIHSICDKILSLSEEMRGLCEFMKEQTLCTIGDAVHSMIPSGALSGIITVYKAVDNAKHDGQYADVFHYIQDEKIVTKANIEENFGLSALSAITYLLHKELIEKDVIIKNMTVGKEKKYYTLAINNEQLASLLGTDTQIQGFRKLRSETAKSILSLLAMRERLLADDIKTELGATDAQISALLKKEYISKEVESVYRNPYEHKSRINHAKELELSDEQTHALNSLSSMLDSGKPSCALLHGVTGSGKTCVMMKIIDHA